MATKKTDSPEDRQPRIDVRKCMSDVLVEQNRLERRERDLVAMLKSLVPEVSAELGKRITRLVSGKKSDD